MRKLTRLQYEEAKKMNEEGLSLKRIARKFKWRYDSFVYWFNKYKLLEEIEFYEKISNIIKTKNTTKGPELLDVNEINKAIDELNLNRYEKEFYNFYCIFYNILPDPNDANIVVKIMAYATPQQAKSMLLTYAKKMSGEKVSLQYLYNVISHLNLKNKVFTKKDPKTKQQIIKPSDKKEVIVQDLKDYMKKVNGKKN